MVNKKIINIENAYYKYIALYTKYNVDLFVAIHTGDDEEKCCCL